MVQESHTAMYGHVITTFRQLVCADRWHDAEEYVSAKSSAVLEDGMTMIGEVFQRLSELEEPTACLDAVTSLLCSLCRTAHVKEALVALLETLHLYRMSDACFQAALSALQLLLLSRGLCKLSQLDWVLTAVYQRFLSAIDPCDSGERLSDIRDSNRVVALLVHVVTFVSPFVDRLASCGDDDVLKSWLVGYVSDCLESKTSNRGSQSLNITQRTRYRLLAFIFAFFDNPLFSLRLKDGAVLKSVVESLMNSVSRLVSNYMLFTAVFDSRSVTSAVPSGSDSSGGIPERLSSVASPRAVALYLLALLVDGVCLQQAPAVFSAEYVCARSLPAVVILLQQQEPGIEPALALAQTLLAPLSASQLSSAHASAVLRSQLFPALARCAERCQSESARARCARALKQFEAKLSARARHLVLSHLLNNPAEGSSSSVLAYFIDRVRANAVIAFSLVPGENNVSALGEGLEHDMTVWFLSRHLQSLVRACCRISFDSGSELVENHTRIMAALSLLRYLLLRDSQNTEFTTCGVAGVLAMEDELESCFLTPLASAIDSARAQLASFTSRQSDGVSADSELSCNIAELQECSSTEQQQCTADLMRTTVELQSSVLEWVRQSYAESC